jgi:hypothetical protein
MLYNGNSQQNDVATDNSFRLNPQKTQNLQIHAAESKTIKKPAVILNGNEVNIANQGKLLGVLFSDTMFGKLNVKPSEVN